jgi:hypothetical protein
MDTAILDETRVEPAISAFHLLQIDFHLKRQMISAGFQ